MEFSSEVTDNVFVMFKDGSWAGDKFYRCKLRFVNVNHTLHHAVPKEKEGTQMYSMHCASALWLQCRSQFH